MSLLGPCFLLISFHTDQQLSMRDLPYLSQRLQICLPPLAFMITEVVFRGSVCNCIAGRLMACTWRKRHPPRSSQLPRYFSTYSILNKLLCRYRCMEFQQGLPSVIGTFPTRTPGFFLYVTWSPRVVESFTDFLCLFSFVSQELQISLDADIYHWIYLL